VPQLAIHPGFVKLSEPLISGRGMPTRTFPDADICGRTSLRPRRVGLNVAVSCSTKGRDEQTRCTIHWR
jgi:hypothetical protein